MTTKPSIKLTAPADKTPKIGVNVSGVSESAVKALHAAIASIVNAPHADEKTKQIALQALQAGLKTHPVSFGTVHIGRL